MPLISSAAVHGRTVFLDDNQIPIQLDRQLQYLARVHKLSAVEVDAYLSAAKAGCMDNSDFILSDDDIEYSHVKAPAISPRAPVPVTTSAPPKF